jgi:hypothetical protein
MYAVSRTAFRLEIGSAEVVFDGPVRDGKVQSAVLHQNGASLPMKRVEIAKPSRDRLKAYEGSFYSAELGVTYEVFDRDGALKIRYPRGDIDLEPIGKDMFAGAFPIVLRFTCADGGACNALSIDDGRVLKLRFVKVAMTPVGKSQPS